MEFGDIIQQFSDDHIMTYVGRITGDQIRLGFNFSCINHVAHPGGDARPSANIFKAKDGHYWYHCYACGLHGNLINIFKATNPAKQADKVTSIMREIASEVGAQMPELPSSKEVAPIIRAYKIASSYVKECADLAGHLKSRGIDKVTAEKYAVGSVPSFQHFTDHLTKYYTYDQLKEFGLANAIVFNENNIIMTIHNRQGMPVAFVARNCGVVDDTHPKYCNTKTTEIYSKSETLFFFHECKSAAIAERSLYIVEGYIDALTLHRSSILNSCALGGVALTHHHLEAAKSLGVNEIIFSWDNDPVGVKTTLHKVSAIFADCRGMKIRFVVVPAEFKDADGIITVKGRQAFLDLPKLDLLEYMATVLKPDPEDKDLSLYFEMIYSHLRYVSLNPFKIPDYVSLLCQATGLPKNSVEIALSHEVNKMEHISDKYATTIKQMVEENGPEVKMRGQVFRLSKQGNKPVETNAVLSSIWEMTTVDATIKPIIVACADTYLRLTAGMDKQQLEAVDKMNVQAYYVHDTDTKSSLDIIQDIRDKYQAENYVIFLDLHTVDDHAELRIDKTRLLEFNVAF